MKMVQETFLVMMTLENVLAKPTSLETSVTFALQDSLAFPIAKVGLKKC